MSLSSNRNKYHLFYEALKRCISSNIMDWYQWTARPGCSARDGEPGPERANKVGSSDLISKEFGAEPASSGQDQLWRQ